MPEFTDLPQNKPQEPVLNKETQPLARFYEFWQKEVLRKDTKKPKNLFRLLNQNRKTYWRALIKNE